MRAMVLERARPVDESPLHLDDITLPVPQAGQVRVQVRYCGLCHTDLHTVEGDLPLPRLPLVPGHQIVGIVDAVGTGVRRFKEGDRVGIPWLHSTDGRCEYCLQKLENLCDNAQFTGYHVDGGYAEFTVVGEAYAYPIPKVFSDESAAPLLCAGIIGYRSYRLSGARAGVRLGLYGFGASAHLVLQLARHLGCDVYVFTRTPAHRELAKKLGRGLDRSGGRHAAATARCRDYLRPLGWAGPPGPSRSTQSRHTSLGWDNHDSDSADGLLIALPRTRDP